MLPIILFGGAIALLVALSSRGTDSSSDQTQLPAKTAPQHRKVAQLPGTPLISQPQPEFLPAKITPAPFPTTRVPTPLAALRVYKQVGSNKVYDLGYVQFNRHNIELPFSRPPKAGYPSAKVSTAKQPSGKLLVGVVIIMSPETPALRDLMSMSKYFPPGSDPQALAYARQVGVKIAQTLANVRDSSGLPAGDVLLQSLTMGPPKPAGTPMTPAQAVAVRKAPRRTAARA